MTATNNPRADPELPHVVLANHPQPAALHQRDAKPWRCHEGHAFHVRTPAPALIYAAETCAGGGAQSTRSRTASRRRRPSLMHA